MRVALIQMPVTDDKLINLETARRKIREAAAQGADFAVLPEMFCCPIETTVLRFTGNPRADLSRRRSPLWPQSLGSILSAAPCRN